MRLLPLLLLAALPALADEPAAPPALRDPGAQAYLGLAFKDHAASGVVVVTATLPGPLRTPGQTPRLARGDLILSIDGQVLRAEELSAYIKSRQPGDPVTLTVRLTDAPEDNPLAEPGPGVEQRELRVVLASRADWAGPKAFPRPPEAARDPHTVLPPPDGPTAVEAFIAPHVQRLGLAEPIARLEAFFAETLEQGRGFHTLSRLEYLFAHPTRLPELQRALCDDLSQAADDPRRVLVSAADCLDLAAPALHEPHDLSDPDEALAWLSERMTAAQAALDRALAALDPQEQRQTREALRLLIASADDPRDFEDLPDAGRMLAAMRATMKVDFAALLAAAAELSGLMLKPTPPPAPAPGAPAAPPPAHAPIDLPEELRAAVGGDVLAVRRYRDGWLVYGSTGPNTYDLAVVHAVIDPGGDDTYCYGDDPPPVQVVIDLAGDDTYRGQGVGPAGALMGVSLLVDFSGNDKYEGKALACGAAALGVGILIDHGGADTYRATHWSQGAALYGLGALIDLGPQGDSFIGELLVQGVGGPRALGLLLSEGGNNLYRANGPVPSGYDTPAVFLALSQGFGFGLRPYDSGGIGALLDLAGHDRYEAGEFAQGGGYYWGLGILHDRAGNDLYYGNRYAQGFAAHQAAGILADDAGDDTYWSMTAAAQGAGWDLAIGMLIDRGGDDSFQAGSLSQGAAAMQAIGWLVSLGGRNRFIAPPGSSRGQSGPNAYHFERSGCFSWSLFLNLGGTPAIHAPGRQPHTILATGARDAEQPENSNLHGLFIDLPEPLE